MNPTKIQLVNSCRLHVEERIARVQTAISDLEEALKLETKCSMGDKYETGRAMLHLEFEKLSGQHDQLARLKKTIRLLEQTPPSAVVGFGSAVETSGSNYIIAIPAGKFVIEGQEYFAVGVNSPIAKVLLGKTEGESFEFNGMKEKIESVY